MAGKRFSVAAAAVAVAASAEVGTVPLAHTYVDGSTKTVLILCLGVVCARPPPPTLFPPPVCSRRRNRFYFFFFWTLASGVDHGVH